MITEAGHFALTLALFIAVVQASLPLIGAHHRNLLWMSLDKPTAIAQMLLITFAFGSLTYSHVVSDFSVLNVVQNSHTMKPMLYKIAGVWGNHEGSLPPYARLPGGFLSRLNRWGH